MKAHVFWYREGVMIVLGSPVCPPFEDIALHVAETVDLCTELETGDFDVLCTADMEGVRLV